MKTKREHDHEAANLKSPCRQRESASTFVYRHGLFASRHGANFNRVSSEMFLFCIPQSFPAVFSSFRASRDECSPSLVEEGEGLAQPGFPTV